MTADTTDRDNPYIGPKPFEEKEQWFFFGRDREVRTLLNLLAAQRIVMLHAASGAGKTSLIQAGLVPELKKLELEVAPTIRVGRESQSRPARESNRYVAAVLAELGIDPGSDSSPPILAEHLRRRWPPPDPDAAADSPSGPGPRGVVLVFDQFEEVLTADPNDRDAKAEFFRQLGDALLAPNRWALFALREDHVASLEPYLSVVPTRLKTRFHLDPLDRVGARLAVTGPAGRKGVTIYDDVADALVDDLRRIRLQRADPQGSQEPLGDFVEPVQLQVVCERFWESWRKASPDAIEVYPKDVVRHARVDQALYGYYQDKVKEAAGGDLDLERKIRDWIQEFLITPQKIRNQLLKTYPRTERLDNAVIQRLVNRYIVREEPRRKEVWFELTHDRLIAPILQNNRDWRWSLTRLQRRALEWDKRGRPAHLLLRGDEVAELDRSPPTRTLQAFESEYLSASRSGASSAALPPAPRRDDDPADLAVSGWGVIFAAGADPAVREALAPLLDLRRAQAGRDVPERYREFSGESAYRPGESKWQFLARQGVGMGRAEPEVIPRFLLIVGDPQTIPFIFQYHLDLQYSVGRLDLPTPEHYANYVRGLLEADRAEALPPRLTLFCPRHPFDPATSLSTSSLIRPLAERLGDDWIVNSVLESDATKERLGRLLGGEPPPSLLLTAGHALDFRPDDEHQLDRQGALLCQDYPGFAQMGPGDRGPKPEHYFAATDLDANARLVGTIQFLLSSHTAGTPEFEDFPELGAEERRRLAPRAFTAALPQALLGHPNGGSLAVIGHVERLWAYSFQGGKGLGKDLGLFVQAILRILEGNPVGLAMDFFNSRYAEYSALLAADVEEGRMRSLDDIDLQRKLIAAKDARNYVLLGDPAARLRVVF